MPINVYSLQIIYLCCTVTARICVVSIRYVNTSLILMCQSRLIYDLSRISLFSVIVYLVYQFMCDFFQFCRQLLCELITVRLHGSVFGEFWAGNCVVSLQELAAWSSMF